MSNTTTTTTGAGNSAVRNLTPEKRIVPHPNQDGMFTLLDPYGNFYTNEKGEVVSFDLNV